MNSMPDLANRLQNLLLYHSVSGAEPDGLPVAIAACRSGSTLAQMVACQVASAPELARRSRPVEFQANVDFRFSDGETCVRLAEDVQDRDVFLFQCLNDPTQCASIDDNYLAFLAAVRAFKEYGARRVTGVVPYLAYARQNKSTPHQREPVTARLMADLAVAAGLDALITFHPHTDQISGFYGGVRVKTLNPLEVFAPAFAAFAGRTDVILVAPDAGAARYVGEMSRALGLGIALTNKYRPRPEQSEIQDVTGDFTGKRAAIILDDMISSGGTIVHLVEKLRDEKGIETVYLGISHNLGLEKARQRLVELHASSCLQKIVVTNSIPQKQAFLNLPFLSCLDLSGLLAEAILLTCGYKL